MIRTILTLYFLVSLNLISCIGQVDSRISEIRELYNDYNENAPYMDKYDIGLQTDGAEPSMTIHTDFEGKILIKTHVAHEFGSFSTEYYFYEDVIQFIFFESNELTNHWGEDTVKFQQLQLRFYFNEGQVIKTLKKKFSRIEGQDDDVDMSFIPNKPINYKYDEDANWDFYEERIKYLVKFYHNLDDLFNY